MVYTMHTKRQAIWSALVAGLSALLLLLAGCDMEQAQTLTCRVDESGDDSVLICWALTHEQRSLPFRRTPPRFRVSADLGPLAPGDRVIAEMVLRAEVGDAHLQFMFEPSRWASLRTLTPGGEVRHTATLVTTGNRVEFLVDGGRRVHLEVTFRRPVASSPG
jgi:hypothetical protein